MALLATLGFVTACHADISIKGAGATYPSRVYERWTKRFAELNPGLAVSYSPTGSGDGIKQIKARAVQFGGTDNPLTAKQLSDNHLVQIPMLVGGLVPVINVPSVGGNQLVLSGRVLADIMRGDVPRWDDARIAALNPSVKLPALAVARIVREDASGSTEIWLRYLAASSAPFAAAVPVSQKPVWPGMPMAAKGNDGVAALLKATPGGITYVSYDRVLKDKLIGVRLIGHAGAPIAASEDAFRAAITASDMYKKGDDEASLLRMPQPGAWPVTATSFMLLDATPKDFASTEWAARFVYWCFMHGDELTQHTGFAPLPSRVQARLAGRLLQVRGPSGQMPAFMGR
ncbi:MAG: phosphate ABC transporter substrate-binding protein PstS [Aquabacterium sp.]|nr:phosphate ABC transporter substrate-binding protein PstS [Aquabacterium sp.]